MLIVNFVYNKFVVPMGRKIILGIDGVPYSLMEDLADRGVMPNFERMRSEGTFKVMMSSIPDVSSVSWSSIITGENPGEHGVYGFSDIIPGTYTLSFHDFRSLKRPPFWKTNGGRHVILNVPSTYPAQEMNGCHVAGFVSPRFERAVYPKSLIDKLKKMNYRTDVDSEKGHKSKRLFLEKLFETLDARERAMDYLMDKEEWDVFKAVITGSDRLEHFLWDAYEEEGHKWNGKFLEFFRRVDEIIGKLDSRLGEEDSLMLLSDHGMERVKKNVNLNAMLEEGGLLELGDSGKRYNRIQEGTKAFALEHGRIYLNRKGRYPRGDVEEGEEKEILERIKKRLVELERDGEKVVNRVYTRDEIYHGGEVGRSPDLTVVPKSGYNMRGKAGGKLFEDSPLTGMHNREAFIYVKGSCEKNINRNPKVEDVVPIMELR